MSRLTALLGETITVSILLLSPASTLYAFSNSSHGDSTTTYVLNRVFVQGNTATKSFIILRELPFRAGDTVTAGEIQYGRERIYSTGLFTDVITQIEPLKGGRVDLLILVEERWYIWPYPVVGFRDDDLKRIYVGAGLADLNFSGSDDRLEGMFALGYDPFGTIDYSDPAVGVNKRYVVSLGASYAHGRSLGQQSGNASGQFDDAFADMYVEGGRRFGIYSLLSLKATYNYVKRNEDAAGLVLSPTGEDIFGSLKVDYTYDSRNLKTYATQGGYLDLAVGKYGLGESNVDFGRLSFDARGYLPIEKYLTFALRLHGNLAEGPQIPPYDHVFLGYYERIRGMFYTTSEGESLLGANAELRIPIIKKMTFDLPDFPMRKYISNSFGIYWSFFFDAGETSGKQLDMHLNRALYGYGGGLVFLLPYDFVVQVDFARGGDKRSEFILEFGEAI
ncbi:MAG: BamA/TamA family outer membrane protein [Bacteroidetes bacterium]|nr:BamA/TamA family outer membrane protein [Bacteroidota bacterium]